MVVTPPDQNDLSRSPYPKIVFALRPIPARTTPAYVRRTPGTDPACAVWYRRVTVDNMPKGWAWSVPDILALPTRFDPGTCVAVGVHFTNGRDGLGGHLVLNADGELVGLPEFEDAYHAYQNAHQPGDPQRLPEPKDIRVRPWTDADAARISAGAPDASQLVTSQPAPK
jgi:hypothetical protein